MKIGVVGAGSIGGWVAARLSHAGHDVSVLARGETLTNIRRDGIKVRLADGELHAMVKVSDDASELGPQDLLIFAVKAQSLPAAAASAQAMIAPHTLVMPAMNGVPWWFLDGAPGDLAGLPLSSVDPTGDCARLLPVDQVLGCVVHASTYSIAPGHIQHVMGQGMIVGAARADLAVRCNDVASVLSGAGYDVTVSSNIRQDIWYKLWGNMTMNPLSALTGATCDLLLDNSGSKAFATAIMNEAAKIGDTIGCPINDSPDDRHAVTRKLGAFKTSMLQDAQAGRPLEIDALLGAPQEIARRAGLETPALDHLLGLMRVFEDVRHG